MSDSKFLEIKNRYIGTFADKKTDLKSAWKEKDFERLYESLHKLCGSSGGYGFDDVSKSCRTILNTLNDDVENNLEKIEIHLNMIFDVLQKETLKLNSKKEA